MVEVTVLPYNLRGTEEVSVCAGSLGALEKSSKLGKDFFLHNLEDDLILNQSKNVTNESTASCNKIDDFKSARSHTSTISNILTNNNSRSKNTSSNIIGNGNSSCSSS